MKLLANELSFHEQFHDAASFECALARLMAMRKTASHFGRDLYCSNKILNTHPMPGINMQQAVGRLAEPQRRAVMSWLTRHGGTWDDDRWHTADDWLECCRDIVTDTAVGEAAFRTLNGIKCELVSITPSSWDYSPVEVILREGNEGPKERRTDIENWRDAASLKQRLQAAPPSVRSWDDLRKTVPGRYSPKLVFADDCFAPLNNTPFVKVVADRFCELLGILDRFSNAFDTNGQRTLVGQQIYQHHFAGDRGWFSDSSDSEKRKFRRQLTFPHPGKPGSTLSCTWHGKISHGTHRLHFSAPITSNQPTYIVYAGPKITKK